MRTRKGPSLLLVVEDGMALKAGASANGVCGPAPDGPD